MSAAATAATPNATLVVWRDGGFQQDVPPSWWEAEAERVFPSGSTADQRHPHISMGDRDVVMIQAFSVQNHKSWLVHIEHGEFIMEMWCPTNAALMDFMTSRAPAWMALPIPPPME